MLYHFTSRAAPNWHGSKGVKPIKVLPSRFHPLENPLRLQVRNVGIFFGLVHYIVGALLFQTFFFL